MTGVRVTVIFYLSVFLGALPLVWSSPHGDEGGMTGGHGGMNMNGSVNIEWSDSFKKPNYYRYPDFGFWIWSHIISLILAWTIVLPLGRFIKRQMMCKTKSNQNSRNV